MERREFLARCAAIASGAAAHLGAAPLRAASAAPQYYDTAKLIRVGISSRSFHNSFASTRNQDFDEPGPLMTLLDFPGIIADRYEVHRLEFVTLHFASTEPGYLIQLRRQLTRAHSRLVNIDIPEPDTGGGLSGRDPSGRSAAVEAVKKWIDIAHQLGALSVRADPGEINPADLSPTLLSYRELCSYGRLRRVDVLIENRQGMEPGTILDILRGAGGRTGGALPDFGNFGDQAARAAGLEVLFPRALTVCHAKGVSFDAAGDETTFDFKRCIEIAKRCHFRGIYSVEYEGLGDPYQGVQNVVNELIRYL
jgi:sugar phosphate isomerase/epimerase